MTNHDVVKKLIGSITPIGETNQDRIRFSNLEAMCTLIDNLLFDIHCIAKYNGSNEYSKGKGRQIRY